MKRFALLFVGIFAAALALSFWAPLPIPYLQDFSVMYFTARGLLNGIPVYAYPEQLEFVRGLTSIDFTFHPFPYPPWYALATFYLGWLPLQVAARLWFFINIALISSATWLLTPGWKPTQRLLGILAALMFIPAFGLLIVGQYSAPVLLGGALFVAAARLKRPAWLACALLLMTFKPHIGAILLLVSLGWLVMQNAVFARRAMWFTVLGGLSLAAVGFLADPGWPLNYLQSLGRYSDLPGVQTCGLCASLSVTLVNLFSGQARTTTAAWVSLGLAMAAAALLFWRYRAWLKEPASLMALAAVLTLLLDPYLLNYDYIQLLIPLFLLARRGREWRAWLVYLLPWLALGLGRAGNVIFSLAGLVTFILILRRPIDARA